MKKLILILAVLLASLTAKSQNAVYLVGMDSQGRFVVNTDTIHKVVNSGLFIDLLSRPGTLTPPTIYPNITRPINSTTFTVSTTRNARVYYTVNISCTATIGSTAMGKIALQYSMNSGTTWIDVSDVSNSNTVSLAVVLNSVTAQDMVLCGEIPANALVRMVSTTSGTTTNSFVRAMEVF